MGRDMLIGGAQTLGAACTDPRIVTTLRRRGRKKPPEGGFSSFLSSVAVSRPLRQSEAVANAQVEAGGGVVDNRSGAVQRHGRAALVLHAGDGRVERGALGQVVHVAQGELLGFRLGAAGQLDLV